ncbi:MAG TPA: GNAT family N-acetyltransferase [Falsiroseomonas sp.]|jgi:CelD/BcsL family acetyltransferase involved in cellulose biosynthesis|nr:GNAT family N-acetyltransferase [Falsiroseomonas sp.]
MPLQVRQIPLPGLAELGATWRGLEAQAAPSFFRSWTWIGCRFEERYPDPVLLRAERDGRLIGLALYNRRGGGLHLAESGDPELDRPFVEHNGPLATDLEAAAALLRAAWQVSGARRLVLGGVSWPLVAAAGGATLRVQPRLAPFLDLDALRAAGGDYLAGRSANARYQIRRSNRLYEASGPLALARAETRAVREAWLEELVALHDASWQRRGQPGAFATPYLLRFHRCLMARAMERGELDLLRITAGPRLIGLLYNVRSGRRVHAYQTGLADTADEPHARPGLTCHCLAIGMALDRGDAAYDLLAGDQRYKLSLADREAQLWWVELAPAGSMAALIGRLRALAGQLRRRWRQPL